MFDYTKAIAHHEAGHGVVWEVLTGRRPFEYLFDPHNLFDPHAGVAVLRGKRARFWIRYHRPACIMGASGAAAQARFQRKRFRTVWESDVCTSDRQKFAALQRKCGVDAEELFSAAQRLVQEHWATIEDVAAMLYAHGGNFHMTQKGLTTP